MNQPTFDVTVPSDQVNEVISKGLSKGWVLVSSTPQEDGQVLLHFRHNTAIVPQAYNAATRPLDPNIAWLELLGFFGFLGIGYLVANRVNDGLIRLIGFWVVLGVGWVITAVLSLVVIGLCLIPVMIGISFAVPIWSALQLRQELEAQGA